MIAACGMLQRTVSARPATGSPKGDSKGTGFDTPAAPATVSGEPSGHMPLGFLDPEKAVRNGVDPQARRPA